MYALNSATNTTSKPRKVTPNLLPCTINHNGPVSAAPRYWSPTSGPAKDNTTSTAQSTAYFRGRLLHGRTLALPEGYTGMVLNKTDALLPKPRPTAEQLRAMEEDDDAMDVDAGTVDEGVEVKMLECQGTFDEVVVWGHEMLPDGEDVYVKGVEEWIGFAEAVCHAPSLVPYPKANVLQMHCDKDATTAPRPTTMSKSRV